MYCTHLLLCFHFLAISNNMLYPKEDKERRVLLYAVSINDKSVYEISNEVTDLMASSISTASC